MKRWALLAGITVLVSGALILSERRKPEAPVRPDPVIYFVADTERELSRLPVALTRISDEEEIRIGDALARQYAPRWETPKPESFQAVSAYVSRVGASVAARAHRKLPYKFHYLASSDGINAFALPGGHVFIGAGLLALMDSEDQLAAVLGHEIEHIDHYHAAERVQTEAQTRKLRLGVVGALLTIPIEVFQLGYSKTEELEADREGTKLAVWASYSPVGAIRMFETFDRLFGEYVAPAATPQEEISDAARRGIEDYFRTHPPNSERIEQIRRMIAEEHWENQTRERPLEVAYVFWIERAQRLYRVHRYEQAVGFAKRSLQLKPDQPAALSVLGRAQFMLADFAAAAVTFRRFLDLSSGDEVMAARYAYALSASSDIRHSAQEYQTWVARTQGGETPGSLVKVHLVGLLLLAGNQTAAGQAIAAAESNPGAEGAPEVLGTLGSWFYRAGDYEPAKRLLLKAAEQRPTETAFQINLAWVLMELRQFESAIQRLNTVSAAGQMDIPGTRMGLAVAHWQARDPDRALRYFEEAVKTEPQWLNARWVRAFYSPRVAQSIPEMQTEQKKRAEAARRALRQSASTAERD